MTDPTVIGQIPPQADTEPGKAEGAKPTATAAPKPRAGRALPTDRVAFTKQMQILRAYAIAHGTDGRVVAKEDLQNITKLNITTVGLNNTFLAEAGLIAKSGNGYVPVPEVIAFNRAYAFNADTAGHKLAPLLRRAWFGEPLLRRLELGPLSEQEAIAELADVAAATAEHATQLRTLLDYLAAAGLIERENNMVREGPMARGDTTAAARSEATATRTTPSAPADLPPPRVVDRSGGGGGLTTGFKAAPGGGITFNIDMTLDMAELATWPPEVVAAFMDGLARVISAKAMIERSASR